MLFNSVEYLLFLLPIALVGFRFLSRWQGMERQILWLVLVSLFFYGSWEPVYLLLIGASVGVNFTLGKQLKRCAGKTRSVWLALGVAFNLGLLGYFKYTGFFIEGLNALGVWLIPIPEITLPLAISFFTFQQIAYLVDVARGECEEYQFHHYALFVLFFPQLIAGPIVHHKEMMPQFEKPRPAHKSLEDISVGMTLIALGLFKKVVVADSMAEIVDPVFNGVAQGALVNQTDALLASVGFSFQIYFDFSGYSDIAIGSARLFGIRLPENFDSPYKSASVIDIWRRWHMTLSRFLRDYLYFSLGGNRNGRFRRYRNLMLTMLLGGLWHGAAWTFVIWGGLHGLYLCVNHAWRALTAQAGLHDLFAHRAFTPMFVLLTFLGWTVAMVFFRAVDTATAWSILAASAAGQNGVNPELLAGALQNGLISRVFSIADLPYSTYVASYVLLVAAGCICWLLPNSQQFLRDWGPVITAGGETPPPARFRWQPGYRYALLTALLLGISILNLADVSRFIYFQF